MSFVQLQKVLPTPAVSSLSAPEETLSFLLNTKCHLLPAWSYWLLRANIVLVSRFGFGFGLDWITDTFVVTCCQMSAERK